MPNILEAQRGFAELDALQRAGIRLSMIIDVKDALAIAHLIKLDKMTTPMPKEAQKAVDYYLSNLKEALNLLNCPQLARAVTE